MLLSESRENWGWLQRKATNYHAACTPGKMSASQGPTWAATEKRGLHHLASISLKTADCGHEHQEHERVEGWQSGKPWGRPSAGSPRLREAAPGCLSLAGNHGQLILVTSRGDPDREL